MGRKASESEYSIPFMASIADSDASASQPRESNCRKQRKIQGDNGVEGVNHTRWRSLDEQKIYSSKLVEALCQLRRNESQVTGGGGRAIRETADRVLAVAAKGRTRWSRAILTSRLSLRLSHIHRKHKRAKAAAKTKRNLTGDNRMKKSVAKKKLPAVQKKVRVLGQLVPGCRKLSFPNLLEETTDYIAALEMQVRTMSAITELLAGAVQTNRLAPSQS